MTMANREVRRIFIDTGAASDILFYDAFIRMGLINEALTPVDTSVYGLGGPDIMPIGMVDLHVTVGTTPKLKTATVTFLVLKVPSPYNVIFGQTAIDTFQMVVSLPHQKAKFKTLHGIGEVRGNLEDARRCYKSSLRRREALPSWTEKKKLPRAWNINNLWLFYQCPMRRRLRLSFIVLLFFNVLAMPS
jgi:hypothetical protein